MATPIEKAIVELIRSQRFYAEMLLRMKRKEDKNIPTIGVGFTVNGIELVYNPFFFENLSLEEQCDILKHEAHHILNGHFDREKELEPDFDRTKPGKTLIDKLQSMQNATRLNMAEDYAINEYLPNLPKKFKIYDEQGKPIIEPDMIMDEKTGQPKPNPNAGKPQEFSGCFVENLAKELKDKQVLREQAMEYYYELLKDKEKQDKKDGKGQTVKVITIDDHSISATESDMDGEFQKEMAKQLANDALEACNETDRGSIPSNVMHLIEMLNYRPKDWRQDLRKFTMKCAETKIESSRSKRNRRQREDAPLIPGYRVYPQLKLVIGFDTSGSMSDEVCEQIWAELFELDKLGVKMTVIQCDADIQSIEDFDPRKVPKTNGRGGTCFAPVFNKIEEKTFRKKHGDLDGLIFFTDGYNFDEDSVKKPKYPVLWGVTECGKISYPWGMQTEVKVRKK